MADPRVLETEEYVEQAYFFRTFRERMAYNLPTQEILLRIGDEILSTTQLPLAIDFLNTELKHAGVLGPAMERIAHYFTAYQAFVVQQAETENSKFSMDLALAVLEREAEYKSRSPTRPGLFIFQIGRASCRERV